MTKLVITEKNFSRRRISSVITGCCNKKHTIRYKRGQIYIYFYNKDLEHRHVVAIAQQLHMGIVSESSVRAVIGYEAL